MERVQTADQILSDHGIHRCKADAYHVTCPRCSHARQKKTDKCLSVTIDDRGVRAWCHHCGWKLVEFYDAPGRPTSRAALPREEQRNDNGNGRRALELWEASGAFRNSPGHVYLRSRAITELPPRIGEALRFHPCCPFNGGRRPCIVALLRNVRTDAPQAIHRTAINGGKAERMTLGPKTGAAIKLDPDDAVEQGLTIGEGIETTLAAWQYGFRPSWSCVDAGNLGAFPVLPDISELVVIVDNDLAGHKAARDCSARWTAAGRTVKRIIPDQPGADFNDLIRHTS
jgi:hypothetical protein